MNKKELWTSLQEPSGDQRNCGNCINNTLKAADDYRLCGNCHEGKPHLIAARNMWHDFNWEYDGKSK